MPTILLTHLNPIIQWLGLHKTEGNIWPRAVKLKSPLRVNECLKNIEASQWIKWEKEWEGSMTTQTASWTFNLIAIVNTGGCNSATFAVTDLSNSNNFILTNTAVHTSLCFSSAPHHHNLWNLSDASSPFILTHLNVRFKTHLLVNVLILPFRQSRKRFPVILNLTLHFNDFSSLTSSFRVNTKFDIQQWEKPTDWLSKIKIGDKDTYPFKIMFKFRLCISKLFSVWQKCEWMDLVLTSVNRWGFCVLLKDDLPAAAGKTVKKLSSCLAFTVMKNAISMIM